MRPDIPPQLIKLEAVRERPVVVYDSMFTADSVRILYECLRKLGQTDRLDLVLSTSGGSVTTARQVALLLREYTQHLTVLVPYRARSAGTLFCLGADDLVLGPIAELGPIDTHIDSVGQPPSDAPSLISAEDIRAFREMAEDWFGIERDEDRIQVLALLAQRMFPTSLASFYRFDKLVRQIGNELLGYQIPDTETSKRKYIVDQLVGGYYAHDYVLSRTEVSNLGLRVSFTSPQEEELLWDLIQGCRSQAAYSPEDNEEVERIISAELQAQRVVGRTDTFTWQPTDSYYQGVTQEKPKSRSRWHRLLRSGGLGLW